MFTNLVRFSGGLYQRANMTAMLIITIMLIISATVIISTMLIISV